MRVGQVTWKDGNQQNETSLNAQYVIATVKVQERNVTSVHATLSPNKAIILQPHDKKSSALLGL